MGFLMLLYLKRETKREDLFYELRLASSRRLKLIGKLLKVAQALRRETETGRAILRVLRIQCILYYVYSTSALQTLKIYPFLGNSFKSIFVQLPPSHFSSTSLFHKA